jgi:hypothetical protein
VLLPTLGGSVPLWAFTAFLGLPTLVLPYANAGNRQHGPNEHLRLDHLFQAFSPRPARCASWLGGRGVAHTLPIGTGGATPRCGLKWLECRAGIKGGAPAVQDSLAPLPHKYATRIARTYGTSVAKGMCR